MTDLFCDCCCDIVKAVFTCKFVYHDGLECKLNICVECMSNGILEIDLGRKRMVAKILERLSEMKVRKPVK